MDGRGARQGVLHRRRRDGPFRRGDTDLGHVAQVPPDRQERAVQRLVPRLGFHDMVAQLRHPLPEARPLRRHRRGLPRPLAPLREVRQGHAQVQRGPLARGRGHPHRRGGHHLRDLGRRVVRRGLPRRGGRTVGPPPLPPLLRPGALRHRVPPPCHPPGDDGVEGALRLGDRRALAFLQDLRPPRRVQGGQDGARRMGRGAERGVQPDMRVRPAHRPPVGIEP